jgi:hypothetical protein
MGIIDTFLRRVTPQKVKNQTELFGQNIATVSHLEELCGVPHGTFANEVFEKNKQDPQFTYELLEGPYQTALERKDRVQNIIKILKTQKDQELSTTIRLLCSPFEDPTDQTIDQLERMAEQTHGLMSSLYQAPKIRKMIRKHPAVTKHVHTLAQQLTKSLWQRGSPEEIQEGLEGLEDIIQDRFGEEQTFAQKMAALSRQKAIENPKPKPPKNKSFQSILALPVEPVSKKTLSPEEQKAHLENILKTAQDNIAYISNSIANAHAATPQLHADIATAKKTLNDLDHQLQILVKETELTNNKKNKLFKKLEKEKIDTSKISEKIKNTPNIDTIKSLPRTRGFLYESQGNIYRQSGVSTVSTDDIDNYRAEFPGLCLAIIEARQSFTQQELTLNGLRNENHELSTALKRIETYIARGQKEYGKLESYKNLLEHTIIPLCEARLSNPDFVISKTEETAARTLQNVQEWARQTFGEKLIVSDKAAKNIANSQYKEPELVLRSLELIGNEYYAQKCMNEKPDEERRKIRKTFLEAVKALRVEVCPVIKAKYENTLSDAYYVQNGDEKLLMNMHIKRGGAQNGKDCLRIYFAESVNPQTKELQIVIGHGTDHLRNSLTN